MNRRTIIMNILGFICFAAFLVVCSEPVPGTEPGVWAFTWPKILAMGVIAGCVFGIRRIDKRMS